MHCHKYRGLPPEFMNVSQVFLLMRITLTHPSIWIGASPWCTAAIGLLSKSLNASVRGLLSWHYQIDKQQQENNT